MQSLHQLIEFQTQETKAKIDFKEVFEKLNGEEALETILKECLAENITNCVG